MEVIVTKENFDQLKNGETTFVVDFWAEWCGPCKMISPLVTELADDFEGRIIVGKCNIEDNEDLVRELGIRNIPTILFYKKGILLDKQIGATSKTALREKFEENI